VLCGLGTVHMYSICRKLMITGRSSLVSESLSYIILIPDVYLMRKYKCRLESTYSVLLQNGICRMFTCPKFQILARGCEGRKGWGEKGKVRGEGMGSEGR